MSYCNHGPSSGRGAWRYDNALQKHFVKKREAGSVLLTNFSDLSKKKEGLTRSFCK